MRHARHASPAILINALPVAVAIGVFGVIYGATASTIFTPGMTVASSLLMFSGAAQFTMVALVDAGATASAVLLAVTALSLRHLPLAAIVLPGLTVNRPRRALLAFTLIDETAGLAVATPRSPARTMAVVGVASYLAWVAGTVAGVAGANLVAAAPLASVVFMILFIGLSALTSRSPRDRRRAAGAAIATAALLIAFPAAGVLGAIVVATCSAAILRRTEP